MQERESKPIPNYNYIFSDSFLKKIEIHKNIVF